MVNEYSTHECEIDRTNNSLTCSCGAVVPPQDDWDAMVAKWNSHLKADPSFHPMWSHTTLLVDSEVSKRIQEIIDRRKR